MHGGRGKFRKGRKIPEVTWYVWATCAKRESLSHAPVARIYIRNDSTDATRCSSSPHEFQSNSLCQYNLESVGSGMKATAEVAEVVFDVNR